MSQAAGQDPARASRRPLSSLLRQKRWALFCGALVLGVAFGNAACCEHQAELWRHLATGRLLVQGRYPFGSDPFRATPTPWINHAWLVELLAYLVYSWGGGAALIALKVLACTFLAALLFSWGPRTGAGSTASAAGTLLVLLVLLPYWTFQFPIFSYLSP